MSLNFAESSSGSQGAYFILSHLYNTLFNPSSPSYLKERFSLLYQAHNLNLRSTESLQLQTLVDTSQFYGSSFTAQGVRLRNAFTFSIRSSKSLTIF